MPDYEIVEWGNDEFQRIKNEYAEQAFNNRKWAFVSDYIRLHALYHEGGIYLDSAVEVVEKMDFFFRDDFFNGF